MNQDLRNHWGILLLSSGYAFLLLQHLARSSCSPNSRILRVQDRWYPTVSKNQLGLKWLLLKVIGWASLELWCLVSLGQISNEYHDLGRDTYATIHATGWALAPLLKCCNDRTTAIDCERSLIFGFTPTMQQYLGSARVNRVVRFVAGRTELRLVCATVQWSDHELLLNLVLFPEPQRYVAALLGVQNVIQPIKNQCC